MIRLDFDAVRVVVVGLVAMVVGVVAVAVEEGFVAAFERKM